MRNFAAAVLLLGLAAPSIASAQTDQSNSTGGSNVQTSALGQSFTPTLGGINFASFSLATSGVTTTAAVTVYQGQGFTGTVLGTSASRTFTNFAYSNTTFTFATPITLTPNTPYTLRIIVSGGASYIADYSATDVYSRGQRYSTGGSVTAGDLVFAEGLSSAAPEPGAWALMILGFGIVGGVLRTRKRGMLALT